MRTSFYYSALISPTRDKGFSFSFSTLRFCNATPEEYPTVATPPPLVSLHHNQKTKKEKKPSNKAPSLSMWERRLKPEVRRKLLLHVLSLKSQISSQILVIISHKTKWILRNSRYMSLATDQTPLEFLRFQLRLFTKSWERRRCYLRCRDAIFLWYHPQFNSLSSAVFKTNLPSSNMTPTSVIVAMEFLLFATVVDSFFAPSLNVSAEENTLTNACFLSSVSIQNLPFYWWTNNFTFRLERSAWRISSSNTKTQGLPQVSSQRLDHSHQLSNQVPRRDREPEHWTYM